MLLCDQAVRLRGRSSEEALYYDWFVWKICMGFTLGARYLGHLGGCCRIGARFCDSVLDCSLLARVRPGLRGLVRKLSLRVAVGFRVRGDTRAESDRSHFGSRRSSRGEDGACELGRGARNGPEERPG